VFLKGTARESLRRTLVATASQFSYICIRGKIGHLCSESQHTGGPRGVLALYPPSIYKAVCNWISETSKSRVFKWAIKTCPGEGSRTTLSSIQITVTNLLE